LFLLSFLYLVTIKNEEHNGSDSHYQAPTRGAEYEACLRWEDPVWDREVMKVRRQVFLLSALTLTVHFVPTLYNMAYGGAPTIEDCRS
jgi:hypothetical protein